MGKRRADGQRSFVAARISQGPVPSPRRTFGILRPSLSTVGQPGAGQIRRLVASVVDAPPPDVRSAVARGTGRAVSGPQSSARCMKRSR